MQLIKYFSSTTNQSIFVLYIEFEEYWIWNRLYSENKHLLKGVLMDTKGDLMYQWQIKSRNSLSEAIILTHFLTCLSLLAYGVQWQREICVLQQRCSYWLSHLILKHSFSVAFYTIWSYLMFRFFVTVFQKMHKSSWENLIGGTVRPGITCTWRLINIGSRFKIANVSSAQTHITCVCCIIRSCSPVCILCQDNVEFAQWCITPDTANRGPE